MAVRTEQHEAFRRQMSPPHLETGEAGGAMGVYPWARLKPSLQDLGRLARPLSPTLRLQSRPGGANYPSTSSAEEGTRKSRGPKPRSNCPAGSAGAALLPHPSPSPPRDPERP